MAGNILQKYLWLLDELTTFKALSLSEIKRLWSKSVHSEGKELSDRTFHHFKEGIRDTFHIEIQCTPSGGDYLYSIKETDNKYKTTFLRSMLLNYHINNNEYLKGKVADLDADVEETLFNFVHLIENKSVIAFRYTYCKKPIIIPVFYYSNFLPLSLIQAFRQWFLVGVFCSDSGPLKVEGRIAVYDLFTTIENVKVTQEHSDYKIDFRLDDFIENFSLKDEQYEIKTDGLDPAYLCDYIFCDDSAEFMDNLRCAKKFSSWGYESQ